MKQKLWMALLCIMLAASCAFGFAACDNAPGHDDSDPSITIPDGGNQEPHEHTYGEWVIEQEATCMSDGTRVRTCRTCMDEQTETIPALGHRFVNGVCDRCGAADPSVPPEPVQDLQYQFNGSGYTVTGIGTMSDAVLTIPSTYLGHLVTAIGESAFAGITWLSEVTIPNGVTSIGNNAFSGCTGLERIDLPEEVTSIGFTVFYGCTGLTSVEIPYGVTSIGGYAFSDCIGLTSIDIPVSVTEIGNSAFNGCTGFTSIEIPDSVTEIGRNAFYGCTRLERIVIPGCVTRMNDHFAGCTRLKNVVISDGVTKIANGAFEGLTSLETIDIPRSVTSIGSGAFRSCTGLVSIVVAEGNSLYHSAGNCLIETQSKTLLVGCKNSIIPDDGSVTSIGVGAFSNCTGLESVVIPGSVIIVGSDAFYGCTGLTSIVICNGVVSIAEGAFQACTGLTSIVIPDSVSWISNYAFYGCTALESAVFKNPEGWTIGGVRLSSEDFSDLAVVASLLVDYRFGVWERVTL